MKDEIFNFPSEKTVNTLCQPTKWCCCLFLSRTDGTAVCSRNSPLEHAQIKERASKGLPTTFGRCTGYPLFLTSLERDHESYLILEYPLNLKDRRVNMQLTFYTYLYFREKAQKRNIPLQDYLREVAEADLEKRRKSG